MPARLKKNKVMVFGTFDVLHRGHLDFFRQARRLVKSPHLIVSVARDANVKKIKGRLPRHNESRRLKTVKESTLVNKAILGAPKDYISHIVEVSPKIIALGYDQIAYTKHLKVMLAKRGLTVTVRRLKAHKPHIYKSSKFLTKV